MDEKSTHASASKREGNESPSTPTQQKISGAIVAKEKTAKVCWHSASASTDASAEWNETAGNARGQVVSKPQEALESQIVKQGKEMQAKPQGMLALSTANQ